MNADRPGRTAQALIRIGKYNQLRREGAMVQAIRTGSYCGNYGFAPSGWRQARTQLSLLCLARQPDRRDLYCHGERARLAWVGRPVEFSAWQLAAPSARKARERTTIISGCCPVSHETLSPRSLRTLSTCLRSSDFAPLGSASKPHGSPAIY